MEEFPAITTWYGRYPIIYGILYIPVQDVFQQYHIKEMSWNIELLFESQPNPTQPKHQQQPTNGAGFTKAFSLEFGGPETESDWRVMVFFSGRDQMVIRLYLSNENRAPGCLWFIKGMKSYAVIIGIIS